MRYENKFWIRKEGLFLNSNESFDLSGVHVLHSGLDTVKQLYNCLIRPEILQQLSNFFDDQTSDVIKVGENIWSVKKSGKSTGYQYIFKNLDLGYVVLLKSFYSEHDQSGTHLKIEVTPQKIYELSPESLYDDMRKIASNFCTQIVENGIAAHIAVDIKGFEPPKDFESNLVCRAKRQFKHNKISSAQVGLNETSVVYGDGQSYTFGGAASVQFTMYEKDQEAIKSDKIDFWRSVWQKTPSVHDFSEPEYQDGDSIKRLEVRFHHSIIREFCNGTFDQSTGETLKINNVIQLSEHLTALWQYGLNNFRLQHSTSYIHPLWQKLLQDIVIYSPAPHIMYKRAQKLPNVNTRRNVAFWLGNSIRIMCRKQMTVEHVVGWILQSGCDAELFDYFYIKRFGESDMLQSILTDFVEQKYRTLLLSGVAF